MIRVEFPELPGTPYILKISSTHSFKISQPYISFWRNLFSMPPGILKSTTMQSFIFLTFVLLFQGSQGQEKFCPTRDLDNPRCLSNSTQYKCGVFFLDLPGKTNSLGWLGALPDVFKKPKVKADLAVKASLAGASEESFNLSEDQCDGVEKLANSRCFTIVSMSSHLRTLVR